MLRISLLKIPAADFRTWNLCRDCHDRNAVALAIVEPVDHMEISRTATAGANGQLPCEMSFSTCRESCSLFMPDMNPLEILLSTASDLSKKICLTKPAVLIGIA